MIPEVMTRISAYWLISALGFLLFAGIAVRRWTTHRTRGRAAILLFMATWFVLCLDAFFIRQHIIVNSAPSDPFNEAIRAMGALSVWWLVTEFALGSITPKQPPREAL